MRLTLTLTLMSQMDGLDARSRLPVINIAIAALKQLSLRQYQAFKENLIAFIAMDSRVELMEWSLLKIVFRHLDGHFFKPAPGIKVLWKAPLTQARKR